MAELHAYKRGIGTIGLTFSAISAMIGSGWLFSSLYVGQLSGPASILAWVFGGILVMIIALTYAEITTMLPVTGGSTRFPQLSHGTFVSLFFGWITWFSLMTAPPIEVQALIQYASNYFPSLLSKNAFQHHTLSLWGYMVATILMLIFSIINIYSIRLITRLNNIFTVIKIGIAVFTGLILIFFAFHHANFYNPHLGGFLPTGWHGVFTALATGGILFAFNGYKQAVELAGEAKNPTRTILISIIGSLIAVLIIYLILQIAFIGALPKESLALGWLRIHFPGDDGPLVGLLTHYGLIKIALLLSITALIATSAAGLVYSTSAARTLYGLSANRQLPQFLQKVTTRGIPASAVGVNFIIGMAFFFVFHGWFAMAEFLSSVIALSYITGPVCCLSLRYQLPEHKRVFRVPFVTLWCFIGFYVCTLIVFWTGWEVISKFGLLLAISFFLFMIYRLFSKRPRGVVMNWRAAIWMWPYLVGLNVVSFFGTFGGGRGKITMGWDFLLLGLLSVLSLFLAVRFRASSEHVQDTLQRLEKEAETGIPDSVPDEDHHGHNSIIS
jgi:amino acid transporter